jgi:hypothetical protein
VWHGPSSSSIRGDPLGSARRSAATLLNAPGPRQDARAVR